MAQWFEVDAASTVVCGWARGSNAALPVAPEGRLIVAATDEQVAQYESMRQAAQLDSLPALVTFVNDQLVPPVDNRLFVRAETDKTRAQVGESVNVTVTALRPDGSTNTDFVATIDYTLPDGRIYGFTFGAGVASRSIPVVKSGKYRLQSTPEVRFESAVDILAVE